MAQTKRKRQTKHRGNAAGVVESRGRTGRKPTAAEKSGKAGEAARAKEKRVDQRDRPPTWRGAFYPGDGRGGRCCCCRDCSCSSESEQRDRASSRSCSGCYTPISYYTDKWIYNRRQRQASAQEAAARRRYRDERARRARVHRRAGAGELLHRARADRDGDRARRVIVDPGDEAERLLEAIDGARRARSRRS